MTRGRGEFFGIAEIAERLRSIFTRWGYREIVLPVVENYAPHIRKGTKFVHGNRFYLICPDATSRIIANSGNVEKMRVFYIGEVLDGGVRGEWQAGIEFIGGREGWMQAEVLLVAITALEALNIRDFYIDIGSLEVWRRATESIESLREDVFGALFRRNFELVERLPLGEEKKRELWALFNFRKRSSGIERIDRILRIVGDNRIFVDFGTVRPLPYYTDLIFEIYSPRTGRPLGGGGEYRVMGKEAMGFTLNLNTLLSLYAPRPRKRRVIEGVDAKKAYSLARRYVEMGIPVEVEQ